MGPNNPPVLLCAYYILKAPCQLPVDTCAHFCYKTVHCRIFVKCILWCLWDGSMLLLVQCVTIYRATPDSQMKSFPVNPLRLSSRTVGIHRPLTELSQQTKIRAFPIGFLCICKTIPHRHCNVEGVGKNVRSFHVFIISPWIFMNTITIGCLLNQQKI